MAQAGEDGLELSVATAKTASLGGDDSKVWTDNPLAGIHVAEPDAAEAAGLGPPELSGVGAVCGASHSHQRDDGPETPEVRGASHSHEPDDGPEVRGASHERGPLQKHRSSPPGAFCVGNTPTSYLLLGAVIITSSFYFAAQGTPLLDLMINEPQARRWVGVTLTVEILADVICASATLRALLIVRQLTCRWRRTVRRYIARDEVRLVTRNRRTCSTVFYGVRYFMKPRSSVFFRVAFLFEVNEFFWQALAVDQMARAGVTKGALLSYTGLIFANGFSPLALVWLVPRVNKAAGCPHGQREVTKFISRLLLFDAACDCFYALFPLAHLIGRYLIFFADIDVTSPSAKAMETFGLYSRDPPEDMAAFMLITEGEAAFMGGNSAYEVAVKLIARMLPMFLAPLRIRLAFVNRQAGIASSSAANPRSNTSISRPARELRRSVGGRRERRDRRRSSTQEAGSVFGLRPRAGTLGPEQHAQSAATGNSLSTCIKRRVRRDAQHSMYKTVPWWAAGTLWIVVVGFCATIYFRLLTWGECEIPQIRNGCVVPAFPIFQLAFAKDRACACNSLVYDDRVRVENASANFPNGVLGPESPPASSVLNSSATMLQETAILWVQARIEDSRLVETVLQRSVKLNLLFVTGEFASANKTTGLVVPTLFDESVASWTIPEISGRVADLPLWGLAFYELPLDNFPSSISLFRGLHIITIRNARLSRIPSELGDLPNLKQLSFYANRIAAVPSELGRLGELMFFDLRYNQLEELPENFPIVKDLRLSYNTLDRLPASFAQNKQLEELHLVENRFTRLPSSVMARPQPTVMYLDGNMITSLELPQDGLNSRQQDFPSAATSSSTTQKPKSLALVASNPLCSSGVMVTARVDHWEVTCRPSCSPGCLEHDVGETIKKHVGDGECFEPGMVAACKLDGGDCSPTLADQLGMLGEDTLYD